MEQGGRPVAGQRQIAQLINHEQTRQSLVRIDSQTLPDWIIRFNEQGPDGLVSKPSPGAPGKLACEQRWAAEAVARPAVNAHNTGQRPGVGEPWQLEVLRALVKPQTQQVYSELGYTIPQEWLP